jgi:hypothetical protein
MDEGQSTSIPQPHNSFDFLALQRYICPILGVRLSEGEAMKVEKFNKGQVRRTTWM